jgi:hypothetical protein
MIIRRITAAILHPDKIINYIKRKARYFTTIDLLELLLSIQSIYRLLKKTYEPKTVLIIEPNTFHGEILPGFCHYFSELGYNVTLLIRKENYRNGIFSKFEIEEMPNIFCLNNLFMKFILRKISCQYDNVYITSSTLAERFGFFGFFYKYLGYHPYGRNGLFYVEHSFPNIINVIKNGDIKIQQIIQLSENKTENYNIPMINPNYFGKVKMRAKNKKIIFITVGSLTNKNRNFTLLTNAVKELKSKGYRDFSVFVIGRGTSKRMFNNLPEEIKILGKLNYTDLYNKIEQADYFLPLLDPEFEGHIRYLKGETTGSRQLILGFYKIPLIHSTFAKAYNFSLSNSIIYESNNLSEAMEDAINLSEDKFMILQKYLEQLTLSIRKESIKNLEEIILRSSSN